MGLFSALFRQQRLRNLPLTQVMVQAQMMAQAQIIVQVIVQAQMVVQAKTLAPQGATRVVMKKRMEVSCSLSGAFSQCCFFLSSRWIKPKPELSALEFFGVSSRTRRLASAYEVYHEVY